MSQLIFYLQKCAGNQKYKNYALLGAVETGDVNTVKELLEQDADPNFVLTWIDLPLINLAIQKNRTKVIDLLLQYGAKINQQFINKIFETNVSGLQKELVAIVVKYHKKNISLMQDIFYKLVNSHWPDLEVFELLPVHDLRIDDCSEKYRYEYLTPLHICIIKKNLNFVSKLIMYLHTLTD